MYNGTTGRGRRREFRLWAMLVVALALGSLVWAGCGSSSGGGSNTGGSTEGGEPAAESSGSDNPGVPQVNVRFGMQPFGDHSIFVTGLTNGWFEDVGINVEPKPLGKDIPPGKATQELVTNQLDIVTEYAPLAIQDMSQVPDVKMAAFDDINYGTFVFANPELKLETLEERIEGGESLDEAMKKIGEEMKGKSYAIESSGFHRIFYNTVAKLGGINLNSDLELSVLEDPQIVQQALGGQLDFASPAGVAQMVQLFQAGWTPLVSLKTLVEELPPEESAPMLGNTGLQLTESYLNENRETVLRFLSVMYRIIDEIYKDPEKTLEEQATYLAKVSGTEIGAKGLTEVLTEIDPLTPFDKQAEYWNDKESNLYYTKLYQPQIDEAQKGGVLPKGKNFVPKEVIIAGELYEEMVELKEEYEKLLKSSDVEGLSGKQKELAEAAATQYERFNYVDAVRLIKEATA
ncbi:MAG TPA: ABC transporter substrate-binding protein [Solirubrobacterales bacterium]|nr:ABC transporter substrate-binding protein [Solirubrobacterales bacterium]